MSYGSYLVVTCLGIAPCYAILELLFGIPECFSMSILFSFRSHHSKLSKLTLGESEVSVWALESVLTARCLRGLDGLSIRESVCNVRGCELARRMDHRLLKGWQKRRQISCVQKCCSFPNDVIWMLRLDNEASSFCREKYKISLQSVLNMINKWEMETTDTPYCVWLSVSAGNFTFL